MKRDFSTVLKDLDGMPLTLGQTVDGIIAALNEVFAEIPEHVREKLHKKMEEQAGKSYTLARAASVALLSSFKDEENLGEEERFRRYKLAEKVHAGGIVDIEPTERDLIKTLIRKRFPGPVVYVLCARALETDADVPATGAAAPLEQKQ